MRHIAIVGCRPPRVHWMDAHRDPRVPIYGAICTDVSRVMFELLAKHGRLVFVSGGADGVDSIAAGAARGLSDLGAEFVVHLPNYDRHGRRAPLERNALIVADADEIHAWPAPWSRGTWDSVNKAKKAGKPVTVHEPWEEKR